MLKIRIKGEGSCCIREESSDQRQADESRAARRWGGGWWGALLIPVSHGTEQKHTAKCLCFFFSKCGLEANFKAALYASVKGSQKLWTRKIPANTQLYTVAGSCCILNIEKIQQQGLWFPIRYCLGKPLHTLQLLLTANEGAGAQAGHTAAASKWYFRYYDDAGFEILLEVSSVGYFLFLGRSSVEQALADTQSYAVATDTSPKRTHIGCEKMLPSHNCGGKKKKKGSKGTNKENLTQSPINGIGSIYLSMIKCYHCTLIAKFDDDRHPRK